jgi:hypothetical protein
MEKIKRKGVMLVVVDDVGQNRIHEERGKQEMADDMRRKRCSH